MTTVDAELNIAPPEWYAREFYPRIDSKRFPYDWGHEDKKRLYTAPGVYKKLSSRGSKCLPQSDEREAYCNTEGG